MSKYEKFSRDELLALVEKQDGELASKKYGLVWDAEREPEQVVLDCAENFPVLKRMKGKEIRTDDGEDNILIEGDNYHALTVLNYTHKEKIDVIYIDPPYNTGNKDFKYNDRFVDKEDGFRHSKWLNFMEKRLNLAKDLLKETGVIFISINEQELCQLKLLCDRIFGEENYFTVFTIKVRHEDRILKGDKDFHEVVEYLLMYRKSANFKTIKRVRDNTSIEEYVYEVKELTGKPKQVQTGSKIIEEFKPGEFVVNKLTPSAELFKKINIRGSIKEGNSSGRFYIAHLEKLSDKIGHLFKVPNMGNDGVGYRYFLMPTSENKANGDYFQGVPLDKSDTKEVPYPNYFDFESEFNNVGYEGGVEFRNGKKPVEFLMKIFEIGGITLNTKSIVLDFFAGSGSTGEAVMEINRLQRGERKFILCTNNEEEICKKITYPRLINVIKGYNKSMGTGGNLQYFTTALVADTKNKKQTKMSLRGQCTEMLCVKENMFRLDTEAEDYKIFSSNTGTGFLCVYYNLKKNSFKDFLKVVKKLKGKKKIYMFSLSGKVDTELFDGIDECDVEEIPEQIIKRYEELARMNISVKPETIFLEVSKAQKKIFEDKEKDEGARILRIALEKTIKKIAQKNHVNVLKGGYKGEKTAILNDRLHDQKIFNKIQWEENKTFLAVGNNASHGEYEDYDMGQVENFYRHVQSLLHDFGI